MYFRCISKCTCHIFFFPLDGRVFAWGENTYGQVGVGAKNPNIATPYEVSSIASCPIYLVTAGGAHSFALTVSGTLFGWGKNEYVLCFVLF